MQQLIEFLSHHLVLASAFSVVIVLMGLNELWTMFRGEKQLSPADAVRLINDKGPLVLDLRPAADFKRGHILNALNIPAAKIEERISEIGKYKDQVVLCYCALGNASPQACVKLRRLGFGTVHSLKGGLNGWQGASLPVTTR